MPYFLTIAAVVLVVNFYMFFMRRRKGRDKYKKLEEDRIVSERNKEKVERKLQREQVEYAKRVESQNRMFEMYEQVRTKWKAIEDGEASSENVGPSPQQENQDQTATRN